MLVLGIESSARMASAAVAGEGVLLGEFFVNTRQTHSQTLLPMVESLLKNLNIACKDLHRIAVTKGPGSFTGVRIGVASVKGIALPDSIPCCGVSTLEAIAYGGIGFRGSVLCAVMDARRDQVYNALFQAEGDRLIRLTPDRAISIDALEKECREYGDKLMLLGDGAVLCHQKYAQWGARLAPESIRYQRASSVALLAADKPAVAPSQLLPTYLRLPQAERELKLKREKGRNHL